MATSTEIRIAFIGAGGICKSRHLPNLAKIDGLQVVAVSNRTRESSQRIAGEFNIPEVVDDWHDIVDRDDIDAVFIGTWPYMHMEMSNAALKAGKHVFCQARMALDLDQAKRMYAAAKDNPTLVAMLCPPPHRMPFEPFIKQVLDSGQLGDITMITMQSISGANLDTQSITWREQIEFSGKHALAMGIYAETLNAWFGEYKTLTAELSTPISTKCDPTLGSVEIEIPQVVTITGRLKSGAIMTEQHMGLAADKSPRPDSITVFGLNGTLHYQFMADHIEIATAGQPLKSVDVPTEQQNPWNAEQEFITAVRSAMRSESWQISPDYAEGLAYMRKVQAVHLASLTGKTVDPADL